jgi:hypothetical protein
MVDLGIFRLVSLLMECSCIFHVHDYDGNEGIGFPSIILFDVN